MNFLVKHLKVLANVLFKFDLFHDALFVVLGTQI